MKNWKTTVTGVLTIVVALGNAALGFLKSGVIPDLGILIAAIVSGIGLITAKDSNVTGGTAGQ